MTRIHRARLHPPLSRHPGSAAWRPAGVYYREAGRRMTFLSSALARRCFPHE